MDDSPDDPRRRRRGTSASGRTSASGASESRSRRKKSSDADSGSSPTRSKKKKKKKKKKKDGDSRSSAEDALEAKMREKKQRKKKGAKSEAEDALESKIRRKERKKAAAAEEEKVEERASYEDDSYGDDDSYGGDNSHDEEWGEQERGAGKKQEGQVAASGDDPYGSGGGDIRNRPRQDPMAAAERRLQQMDPLRKAEKEQEEKQKNRKEVNPRFAQLHETGQWGGLTKVEKYGICAFILAAIATAIALGVEYGRGPVTPAPTRQPSASPTGAPSATPSMAPTDGAYREEHGLEVLTAASPRLTLPQTPGELAGAKGRPGSTPQELAAEFVLYDDALALPARDPRFAERYALATLYYQNGGCARDWIEGAATWLTGEDHCGNWYGVSCDLQRRVTELNLARNYVTGQIPVELGQMLELSTLDLSNNAMSGAIPARALTMSKMYTIALSNNDFEGEFPFDEVKAGAVILGECGEENASHEPQL